MQRDRKLRALRKALGDEQLKKGNEAVFFCPRKECIDYVTKFNSPKLSVNLQTDVFHCWVCEFKGKNLVPLLRYSGNTQDLQDYIEELEGKKEEKKEEKKFDVPILPKEFKTLSKKSNSPYYGAAISYLKKRGLLASDIVRWKLGYCEDGDYKYRIVIPSYDEFGELNFFTARAFYENPLRYMNGNFCKDIIFNDCFIDWSKPIVVTEGPFDAMKAGDNAIPMQGSFVAVGTKLFNKIVTSGIDVYFAMDTDAFKRQLEIIDAFLLYGVNSYYVNLFGKKDVGEMTKAEFIDAKNRAIHVRDEIDLLRIRMTS